LDKQVTDTVSAMPIDMKQRASDWRYEIFLNAGCLDPYRAWLDASIRVLVIAAAEFSEQHAPMRGGTSG
jgi:hypothetical protein